MFERVSTFPFLFCVSGRRLLHILVSCVILANFVPLARVAAESAQTRTEWLEVELGPIGVASLDILEGAVARVKEERLAGLLLVLDTPGGSLEATHQMVKILLGIDFPLVVWVGPSGARAASAGAFITLAAPIAAMAPGTHIGAAHPVQILGDLEPGSDTRAKIENDTEAFMESIAAIRKRNKEMALSFVSNSLSVSAEEALDAKVIDVIAADRSSLFSSLKGRTINLAGSKELTLPQEAPTFLPYERNWRQSFLEVLGNPDLFYLLFIVGLVGLAFELTHPGAIAPGVVGALALILALIASSVLPINMGALLLVLASLGFMIAELFLPSFGILGIGGFIGFVAGSLLLVDSSRELGLGISWWTVIPGSLVVLGFMALVSYLVLRNQRSQVRSGAEGLIGQEAEALEDFSSGQRSQGQVRLAGEIWNAEQNQAQVQSSGVKKGDLVKVKAIRGLTLEVTLSSHSSERD